jgi:hypothetical protein
VSVVSRRRRCGREIERKGEVLGGEGRKPLDGVIEQSDGKMGR